MKIDDRTNYAIKLINKVAGLNDVIIIGYGTIKKDDLTGAVAKAPVENMQKAPVRAFDEALAGRVAGVNVSSVDGQPGSSVNINYLFEDSKKRIWATTSNSVYIINDAKKPVLTVFGPLAGWQWGIVYVVFEDSKNNIWLGAANGLYKLTANGNSYDVKTYRHDANDINGLADHSVTSIAEDKKGQLWLGTVNGGLHLYNREKDAFKQFKHAGAASLINDHIRKLLPDNENRLWIGTQEGLSVLDINTHRFQNFTNEPGKQESLSQNSIHSLFMDNAGTVWVGTFFGYRRVTIKYNCWRDCHFVQH